jgi:predicted nucleic acid-binding protein
MFVDTGPIVAFWVASDALNNQALELWARALREGRRFATTTMVLTEAALLTSRRGDSEVTRRMLVAILTSPRWRFLEVSPESMLRAARRVGEMLGGSPLSFTDAVSFALLADLPTEPVFTFDRRHFGAEGLAIYGDA